MLDGAGECIKKLHARVSSIKKRIIYDADVATTTSIASGVVVGLATDLMPNTSDVVKSVSYTRGP